MSADGGSVADDGGVRDEARLRAVLSSRGAIAIAVSGGVDSMTLAWLAHRTTPVPPLMVHAVSPAVPARATALVRAYAAREGWDLAVTGAGEFDDPSYRANPVDRCYFCKNNLYARIRALTDRPIASGTNEDDLGDYRPGLRAAAERGVIHPYVEAGIGKAAIYALARVHGLADLAALPAQPCLASRVETGIAITADDLAFIEQAEQHLAALLPAGATLRCRITRAGVIVETAAPQPPAAVTAAAEALCQAAGRPFAGLRPYRRGAAFLHG